MRNELRDKTDDELGQIKLGLESVLAHRGLTAEQRECILAFLDDMAQLDETSEKENEDGLSGH